VEWIRICRFIGMSPATGLQTSATTHTVLQQLKLRDGNRRLLRRRDNKFVRVVCICCGRYKKDRRNRYCGLLRCRWCSAMYTVRATEISIAATMHSMQVSAHIKHNAQRSLGPPSWIWGRNGKGELEGEGEDGREEKGK